MIRPEDASRRFPEPTPRFESEETERERSQKIPPERPPEISQQIYLKKKRLFDDPLISAGNFTLLAVTGSK